MLWETACVRLVEVSVHFSVVHECKQDGDLMACVCDCKQMQDESARYACNCNASSPSFLLPSYSGSGNMFERVYMFSNDTVYHCFE